MANLGQQFDATQVAPATGYDVIPKGEYIVRISDSDVVENNAKTGTILKITLEVAEGQYQGRKIFDQLNLTNPNEMAVKIARERLSAYCHATGVIQLQDSQQLHGIPFIAKVKVKVDKNGVYDDRNEMASCKKLEAGQGFGGAPACMAQGGFTNQGGAPAGFGGAPAGFQNQGQPQGGYGQFAGQPQGQPQGFQTQPQQNPQAGFGQAGFQQGNPQGQGQLQGQAVQATNPMVNQAVDTSPVPEMQFATTQPQTQQVVTQDQAALQGQVSQAGFGGQVPNQQVAQKAPWEQ